MKFLKSSSNVIIINLILFYIKKIKKKKTIIFYHPNENLILIHQKFIEKLLRNNNYFCIYLHQNNSLKKNNYYFVINYFCKLIFNSDYFISNNVCDFFSQFSKRIYIHHDVYDTPLVNKKKQQKLKQRLLKYNNIFLASKNTKLIFDILFKSNSNRPVISIIGYFKLDYILKKKNFSTKFNSFGTHKLCSF